MLARVKLLPEALAMLEKYKDPTRPTQMCIRDSLLPCDGGVSLKDLKDILL